jgi:hypothetical protein
VSVPSAATALAYTAPAVVRAMRDLEAAGLVRSVSLPSANEYWLERGDWRAVLGWAPPAWGFWLELLAYVCAVLRWQEASPADEAGEALRALAERHEANLIRAGFLGDGLQLPRTADVSEWRRFHAGLGERIAKRT